MNNRVLLHLDERHCYITGKSIERSFSNLLHGLVVRTFRNPPEWVRKDLNELTSTFPRKSRHSDATAEGK